MIELATAKSYLYNGKVAIELANDLHTNWSLSLAICASRSLQVASMLYSGRVGTDLRLRNEPFKTAVMDPRRDLIRDGGETGPLSSLVGDGGAASAASLVLGCEMGSCARICWKMGASCS